MLEYSPTQLFAPKLRGVVGDVEYHKRKQRKLRRGGGKDDQKT